jgi:hypothetical protein
LCRSCVNNRRRKRYATKRSEAGHESSPRLQNLVKKGDFPAVKKNRSLSNARKDAFLWLMPVVFARSKHTRLPHLANGGAKNDQLDDVLRGRYQQRSIMLRDVSLEVIRPADVARTQGTQQYFRPKPRTKRDSAKPLT